MSCRGERRLRHQFQTISHSSSYVGAHPSDHYFLRPLLWLLIAPAPLLSRRPYPSF